MIAGTSRSRWKRFIQAVSATACVALAAACAAGQNPRSIQYTQVQQRLQQGWNTWDTHTVLGEVLLPRGLEIRLGLKRNSTENSDAFLPTALIGRRGQNDEEVHPGDHAYDGSYSELTLTWRGQQVKVQAAHAGPDLVMLVTPLAPATASRSATSGEPLSAVFSAALLWNQPGSVRREGSTLLASLPGATVPVYLAGTDSQDLSIPIAGPYLTAKLDAPVGVSTGQPRSVARIEALVNEQHQRFLHGREGASEDQATVRRAIETTIAWDTIYEPQGHRVITPVSRIWNENWGGYVLFDWDTFFAADLAAVDDRDLAYANVMEILNETSAAGFVPNYARAGGWKSSDRSEPPVGAITVLALYRRFHDRWLLEQTFDRLLRWNAWWPAHRDTADYLTWGSDGANLPANPDDTSKGAMQGARYESGLDNSPMYDTPAFNQQTGRMELADVGLTSLYIADCDALATVADEIGRSAEAKTLRHNADTYRRSLDTLWDPATGMYLNKDLKTGVFSHRLSPTNFYPLLAGAPDLARATRILQEHLLNPQEFWGERVIPSIARNDPAFADQDYWRGRIWGPMNYLVYLGLQKYDLLIAREARSQLAAKSTQLFLQEWRTKGHVHENYSATQDDSDTVTTSDRFYHWGALLGLIGYDEAQSPPTMPHP